MKKNDDLFEFPCVDPDVAEANFFISEYCKRHFEEYADKKDVDFILDKFNEYVSINDNDYKKALSKSRQVLINYEQKINNKIIYDFYNIVEDKDEAFFNSWIKRAYKLTLKYKISVFDLVCPRNFYQVLSYIVQDKFHPDVEIIFCKNVSNVGYEFKYDEQINKIAMIIDVSDNIQDSEFLASNAAGALILHKRRLGLKTSDSDRNILIQASKNDINKNFRANGIYNRSAGILIWDLKRLYGCKFEEAILKMREKNLIYREGIQCIESCSYCVDKVACVRYYRDSYANACKAILNSNIYSTSKPAKIRKKFASKIQFVRYDD